MSGEADLCGDDLEGHASTELEYLLEVHRREARAADAAADLVLMLVGIAAMGSWKIVAWLL